MKRLIAPLVIAIVLGMVVTLGLFFGAAAFAGDNPLTVLSLGGLDFVRLEHARLAAGGSTVAVRPGLGLGLIWALVIGYGLTVGIVRYRRGATLGPLDTPGA
jgi:hypothetical protein